MSDSEHGVQGFAPCRRRLRRPWTPCSLSDEDALMPPSWPLSADAKSPSKTRGL